MIRMVQCSSASRAQSYFSEALTKTEYYTNDQELQGKYGGKLAQRLGLDGPVTRDTFFNLCENINPKNGQPLTPRTQEERTVGYDINFHAPKSVSIIHALSHDNHILESFELSVKETMIEIEKDMNVRVRKDGLDEDRNSNELVYAAFTHQTSRPVDNSLSDPHIHSHVFTFNAAYDAVEGRIKAGKFQEIKRNMPYYQAIFHKKLSDKLIDLGYQIKTTKNAFEIEGVPKNAIELFSKRTAEIGKAAKEKGITDAIELDGLGARTRSAKQKNVSMAELKAEWRDQLKYQNQSLGEKEKNQAVRYAPKQEIETKTARNCVQHSIDHSFERRSVLREKRLLATAIKHSIGHKEVSIEGITEELKSDKEIIRVAEKNQMVCTTKSVLQEEMRMVELAKSGQGKCSPLYQQIPKINLNGQQEVAVGHLLSSKNQVSIIMGYAGTGKTTLMKEAVRLIEETGKKVIPVAPTAQASHDVLKSEGFTGADTVARLLIDTELQKTLKDQVLWIDEAGLLGTKDMKNVLEIVQSQNARLVLSGDTRQHSSVNRGDALRILNTVAGIKAAEVSKIYRQKDENYRSAVESISKGDIKKGFEKLDAMGAIKTVESTNSHELLVADYMKSITEGKACLIISPTHEHKEQLTQAIREKLKGMDLIGKKDTSVLKYIDTKMTEAEKGDWRNYGDGQIIQFNQNLPGIQRGSIWTVMNVAKGKVHLVNDNRESVELPSRKTTSFNVYNEHLLSLSEGDKVQITKNGFDTNKKRLNNGQNLEVVSINKDGNIVLKSPNGKSTFVLDKEHGHIDHGHCITSHASQGKTVDRVFIGQPSATFEASNAKQFYVSVSRARESVTIYTDDKTELLNSVAELGNRQSAIETVNNKSSFIDYVHQHLRNEVDVAINYTNNEKGKNVHFDKTLEYEPEF